MEETGVPEDNILKEIRKQVEIKKLKEGQQKINLYLDQYFPRNDAILSNDREGTDLTDLESISDVAQNITLCRRVSQKV